MRKNSLLIELAGKFHSNAVEDMMLLSFSGRENLLNIQSASESPSDLLG